jgi:EAL domain-containing protein (putative c-di-GMP-specific phosphodiesterase class I)
VYLYDGEIDSVNEVIKRADMAMYQAKDSGRNMVQFFDPQMQRTVEENSLLESDLRHAIPNQQFELYYQIQLDNNHRPVGAEALIRWNHPLRGIVPPGAFIFFAEGSPLILEIGHWVLDAAFRQIVTWSHNELTRDLVIAINISAQQFKQPDFVAQITSMIQKHGVDPSRVKLELTEGVALSDIDSVVAKMHELREVVGVTLSLDDFGTGYSSLSYLKRLPLDQVKIDRSFVCDITTDTNDALMVKTIIDMAHNFGLNVIAEGVETKEQQAFLAKNGCMTFQGYLFSKPVPIDEFEMLLKRI